MIIGKGKTNYEFKKQKEKYEKRKTNIKKNQAIITNKNPF